jgi:hypothetical protein
MSEDPHPLDIPDFLRRTPGERQDRWDVKTVKEVPEARHPWHLPKNMDAACWALVREAERAKEAKKQAGLAALKQWKLENKR